MLLSQVFTQLVHGELSSSAITQEGTEIPEINYPKVISAINLGLTDLFTKFPLKESEIIIQTYDEIEEYFIESKFAASNTGSTEPIKYLLDSVNNPYRDTLLRIERVVDSCGEVLYTNDAEQEGSVFTPSFNSVQIPCSVKDGITGIAVTYRDNHAEIPAITTIHPEVTQVDLPPSYLKALCLFVSAQIKTNTPSLEGRNEGDVALQKYHLACQEIQDRNIMQKDNTTNNKLERNGWA